VIKMVHRYVNTVISKITGDSGKDYDKESVMEDFQDAQKKDKDGNMKTNDNGQPELDSDKFLNLLDNFWLKAKIAGMEEERAKGESSDNLYNIAALGMIASALNTLMLAAVLYNLFG